VKLTGKLFDIGTLEDDKMGFVLRLKDSRLVTVTGLEQAELKALAQHFGESITLEVQEPK
jgi:hypothetical protein